MQRPAARGLVWWSGACQSVGPWRLSKQNFLRVMGTGTPASRPASCRKHWAHLIASSAAPRPDGQIPVLCGLICRPILRQPFWPWASRWWPWNPGPSALFRPSPLSALGASGQATRPPSAAMVHAAGIARSRQATMTPGNVPGPRGLRVPPTPRGGRAGERATVAPQLRLGGM